MNKHSKFHSSFSFVTLIIKKKKGKKQEKWWVIFKSCWYVYLTKNSQFIVSMGNLRYMWIKWQMHSSVALQTVLLEAEKYSWQHYPGLQKKIQIWSSKRELAKNEGSVVEWSEMKRMVRKRYLLWHPRQDGKKFIEVLTVWGFLGHWFCFILSPQPACSTGFK